MSQLFEINRITSVSDIIKGIPLERLAAICDGERQHRVVIHASTESAKRAAEEAYAETFCDLAESSANEWLEQQDAEEANETIKALRCHAEPDLLCGKCRYEGASDCGRRMAADAADLIKSLQAQLAAKEAINQAYSATVSLLGADKAKLAEQLSTSQARERAAIKEICALCRFGRQVGLEAGYQSTGNGCRCETCKWRGQQGGDAE